MASNPATDCLFYVAVVESVAAESAVVESLDLSLTVFFSKGSGALETNFAPSFYLKIPHLLQM